MGGGFDFTRFNPEFWDSLERQIGQLDALGIEADVILSHGEVYVRHEGIQMPEGQYMAVRMREVWDLYVNCKLCRGNGSLLSRICEEKKHLLPVSLTKEGFKARIKA
ncbi:MAG: hypothetical protein HFG57_10625 [Lachnospiraceae bacterium]|nr:hypothetical protein [Lachnospiraceae bacterium]